MQHTIKSFTFYDDKIYEEETNKVKDKRENNITRKFQLTGVWYKCIISQPSYQKLFLSLYQKTSEFNTSFRIKIFTIFLIFKSNSKTVI